MIRTDKLLAEAGFSTAAIQEYNQSMAEDYCDFHGIDIERIDYENDIDWESCDNVSLDRLGDYAYNYNGAREMRGYLSKYCGECSLKEAEEMIKVFKKYAGNTD